MACRTSQQGLFFMDLVRKLLHRQLSILFNTLLFLPPSWSLRIMASLCVIRTTPQLHPLLLKNLCKRASNPYSLPNRIYNVNNPWRQLYAGCDTA